MAWRMTVVIPPELEDAIREEEHRTRTPISRIVRSMLERRYAGNAKQDKKANKAACHEVQTSGAGQ